MGEFVEVCSQDTNTRTVQGRTTDNTTGDHSYKRWGRRQNQDSVLSMGEERRGRGEWERACVAVLGVPSARHGDLTPCLAQEGREVGVGEVVWGR